MTKRTQTVEQTSKVWKASQALGCLGMIVCAVAFGLAMQLDDADTMLARSLSGLAAAALLYLVGRFGGWWYHG